MLREERKRAEDARAELDRREIAERARRRVPENERQQFADWAWNVLQRGNELGYFTLENSLRVINILVDWYYFSKERKMFVNQTYVNDPSLDLNVNIQKKFDSTPTPP